MLVRVDNCAVLFADGDEGGRSDFVVRVWKSPSPITQSLRKHLHTWYRLFHDTRHMVHLIVAADTRHMVHLIVAALQGTSS